jgi:hypothetical protein
VLLKGSQANPVANREQQGAAICNNTARAVVVREVLEASAVMFAEKGGR